jgi:hypothetical protein
MLSPESFRGCPLETPPPSRLRLHSCARYRKRKTPLGSFSRKTHPREEASEKTMLRQQSPGEAKVAEAVFTRYKAAVRSLRAEGSKGTPAWTTDRDRGHRQIVGRRVSCVCLGLQNRKSQINVAILGVNRGPKWRLSERLGFASTFQFYPPSKRQLCFRFLF